MTTLLSTSVWVCFFQEFKFRCSFILVSFIVNFFLSTMYTEQLLSFAVSPLLTLKAAKPFQSIVDVDRWLEPYSFEALSPAFVNGASWEADWNQVVLYPTLQSALEEEPYRLIFTNVTEGFSATYLVCFFFAFYFSFFFTIYHIYAFVVSSTFVFERIRFVFVINTIILLSYHFFIYFYFFSNVYKYLLAYSITTDSLIIQYEGRISSYIIFEVGFVFWSSVLIEIMFILFILQSITEPVNTSDGLN